VGRENGHPYVWVSFFPSRQESASKSRELPPHADCCSASIRFPQPSACEASVANFLTIIGWHVSSLPWRMTGNSSPNPVKEGLPTNRPEPPFSLQQQGTVHCYRMENSQLLARPKLKVCFGAEAELEFLGLDGCPKTRVALEERNKFSTPHSAFLLLVSDYWYPK
jgi:hypothetical protein